MAPRLPDEQAAVVDWLRSPAGEAWTRARIGMNGRLYSHLGRVYLAELIPQSCGGAARMSPPDDPAACAGDRAIDGGAV